MAETETRTDQERKTSMIPMSTNDGKAPETTNKRLVSAGKKPAEGSKPGETATKATPQSSENQGEANKEGDKEKQNKGAKGATTKQSVGSVIGTPEKAANCAEGYKDHGGVDATTEKGVRSVRN